MESINEILFLIDLAKDRQTRAERDYWNSGGSIRLRERAKTAADWVERRKKQAIKIIESF